MLVARTLLQVASSLRSRGDAVTRACPASSALEFDHGEAGAGGDEAWHQGAKKPSCRRGRRGRHEFAQESRLAAGR